MNRQHLSIAAAAIATTTALSAAFALYADDQHAEAATNEVAMAETAATLRDEDVDEIDLEEIDDTAEAAKRPQIRTDNEDVEFVDISCDDATLADVLRQFRKTTRANIISDDATNLQRRVSAELKHVQWFDALQSILNARGFRLEKRGNIYFVSEDKQAIPIITKTFQLNHASANELAALFNDNYAVKDKSGKILQKVANAFPGANAVVVTAPEKVISDCESIISSVDKAVDQIYIEARFIEISSDAMHKFGFDWTQLKSWGASTKDVSAGLTRTTSPNGRAFSGTLSIDDFRLAINAFENIGDAKIFSNPKVIVSNGKEAKVDMTTKYPYIELTSQRNTSSENAYLDYSAKLQQIPGDKDRGLFAGSAFFSYGIELAVKPRISPDGLISVEITPSISYVDEYYSVANGSGTDSDSSYGKFPIVKMKSISTEFTMKDGSTAVIGGLSKTEEEDFDDGIPYLRKIPWIGQYVFGRKGRQKVQYEIIICVTVGIAQPEALPRDIGLPKNAVVGREYVEGRRFEPGDSPAKVSDTLSFDLRTIDKRRREDEEAYQSGKVIITPSK